MFPTRYYLWFSKLVTVSDKTIKITKIWRVHLNLPLQKDVDVLDIIH